MTRLKYRCYPVLLTAITVLAATEGAWRMH